MSNFSTLTAIDRFGFGLNVRGRHAHCCVRSTKTTAKKTTVTTV